MKKNNWGKNICRKNLKKKRKREMASRKKSCEKKVEKRQKREDRGEKKTEKPVGTPPL